MNNQLKFNTLLAIICILTGFFSPVLAADAVQYKGQMITEKTLQGYNLRYHLLDLAQRKEISKGMEGMKMAGMSDSPDVTNHLALYIKGPKGQPVSGKIGFNISHPDGTNYKTMTMGIKGGYGADVMFKAKGVYKIQMKAIISGKTITDEISYKVQ